MFIWQRTWREGFAPQFTRGQLVALMAGLRQDDCRIIQGATSLPLPLACVLDWPLEGCDALTYAIWQGPEPDAPSTVGEAESRFAQLCAETDRRMGEPAACRYFLHWYDETPREEMRRELLGELAWALSAMAA